MTYARPGAVVTPGQWVAGPAGYGPYASPGAAGTATDSLSILAKAFDPAVTAPLGDYNQTAINPNATPAMKVLQPGQSIVVPVTITPSGTAGSVVSGTLYVDALVGGLLPVGGPPASCPPGRSPASRCPRCLTSTHRLTLARYLTCEYASVAAVALAYSPTYDGTDARPLLVRLPGRCGLLLAGESCPGRLAGHSERVTDTSPGSSQLARPPDPSGQALLD